MGRWRIAYAGMLVAALSGCALPVLPALRHHAGQSAGLASAGTTFFFSFVCHQIPERSFHLWGVPMAVCSRCSGVYVGFLVGVLLFPLIRKGREGGYPPPWILGAAVLPAVVDFGLSHLGIFGSNNVLRAATGLVMGGAASFYILPAVFNLVVHQTNYRGNPCKANQVN
jgi:uncharacterized membrane protein